MWIRVHTDSSYFKTGLTNEERSSEGENLREGDPMCERSKLLSRIKKIKTKDNYKPATAFFLHVSQQPLNLYS